jgi:hypothetical protein
LQVVTAVAVYVTRVTTQEQFTAEACLAFQTCRRFMHPAAGYPFKPAAAMLAALCLAERGPSPLLLYCHGGCLKPAHRAAEEFSEKHQFELREFHVNVNNIIPILATCQARDIRCSDLLLGFLN